MRQTSWKKEVQEQEEQAQEEQGEGEEKECNPSTEGGFMRKKPGAPKLSVVIAKRMLCSPTHSLPIAS